MGPKAQPEGLLSGIGEKSATIIAGSLDNFTAMIRETVARGVTISAANFTGRIEFGAGAVKFTEVNGSLSIEPRA